VGDSGGGRDKKAHTKNAFFIRQRIISLLCTPLPTALTATTQGGSGFSDCRFKLRVTIQDGIIWSNLS